MRNEVNPDHMPMLTRLAYQFGMSLQELLVALEKLGVSVDEMHERCCQAEGSGIVPAVMAARGLLHSKSAGGVLVLEKVDGRIELPGGKVGGGLSIRQGLVREWFEETGIVISVDEDPIYIWDKPAGMPPKWIGIPYLCMVFRVHLVNPLRHTVRLSDEHVSSHWIDPTPEHLIPYGDQIPEETRRALDIFYRNHIMIPEGLEQQGYHSRDHEIAILESRIALLEQALHDASLPVP